MNNCIPVIKDSPLQEVVIEPAAKPPGILRSTSIYKEVIDWTESNKILKLLPESFPYINSCANICSQDVQEYYFLLPHN